MKIDIMTNIGGHVSGIMGKRNFGSLYSALTRLVVIILYNAIVKVLYNILPFEERYCRMSPTN
jgi:hypothetical protein